MRNAIAILLLLLSSALTCRAAPPTDESIDTLLTLTKTASLLESMYGNMEQVMRQTIAQAVAGKSLSAEQQRFLDAAPARFVGVMRQELSWESLKPVYLKIYRENFTQEEIDGLISFYQKSGRNSIRQQDANRHARVHDEYAVQNETDDGKDAGGYETSARGSESLQVAGRPGWPSKSGQ